MRNDVVLRRFVQRRRDQSPSYYWSPESSTLLKSHKNVMFPVIYSVTSVIELLECPVSTDSMFPPIHQDELKQQVCLPTFFSCRDVRTLMVSGR
ncbi:hypothetical protein Ancab_032833 [Ancistrocladus abbreviatus]